MHTPTPRPIQEKLRPILIWMLFGFLLISMDMVYANQSYSLGFQAYLDKDYQTAEKHWLAAANQNHARSMFNLGLLYQQGRGVGGTMVEANAMFLASAAQGYAPAKFHLAKIALSRGDQTERARNLLMSASNDGFVPAKRLLSEQEPVVSEALAVGADSQASLNRLYHSEQWLSKQKPTGWTIQLLAFAEISKVREFIDQHKLLTKAAYFKDASGDQVLYKLVYGVYASKAQADVARKNISPALAHHGPWLRSIDSVQAAMTSQK